MAGSRTGPRPGDVLVSKLTASIEHEISIVGEPAELSYGTHTSAVSRARRLAEERRSDAWLTEDHTHFVKIASYREKGAETPEPA